MKCVTTATLLLFSIIAVGRAMAQGKSPSAAAPAASPSSSSPPSSSSSSSGSGLQGKSFTKDTWDSRLNQLPKAKTFGFLNDKDTVFVCYRLVEADNAATPFILVNTPIDANDGPPEWQRNHQYHVSDWVYSSNHNGHYYQVVATGTTGDTGTAGNAEPTFPSAAGTTVQETTGSGITWADRGYFGYSPFVPRWTPNNPYAAGAIVTLSSGKGHYFEAQNKGSSGSREPKRKGDVATEEPAGLSWRDMGDMVSRDKRECADVTSSHPLLMNQNLVVVIEMTGIPEEVQDRFTILNLNVTSQQASPINVTPIQPSIAAGAASGPSGGVAPAVAPKVEPRKRQIYYLTWPSLVTGDSILAINVNLVYTPVAPALPWQAHTFYPVGSIVMANPTPGISSATKGHYYLALSGGMSAATPPDFDSAATGVQTFPEGTGLTWKDMGLAPPKTSPPVWAKNTRYGTGDLAIPTANSRHYYRAQTHATSGANPPSFSTATHGESILDAPKVLNLTWKDMGTNLPVPAPPIWASRQMYYTGVPVTPATNNGHYYRAQTSGESSATQPTFPVDGTSVDDGPNISWTDMGATTLNPDPPMWQANYAYAAGAQVTPNPPNGHYYQAQTAGVTGPYSPAFPVDGSTVLETDRLVWTDSGVALPTGGKLKQWQAGTPFMIGDVVQDSLTGRYYTVIQAGISGDHAPSFYLPTPKTVHDPTYQINWQDLGTTLPSSISSGQPQPADQTVSTIAYSFPQAHSLSYFSLTSGVVVSSIKTPSFLNTSSSSTPNWTTVKNGPIVDPVLALTAFIKPVDAERPWHLSDLTPGASVAFSLTSPGTNFYFGGSSVAFSRNIQVLYGFSVARISILEPASFQVSSTSAATRQRFAKGAFIGVSFNIVGLITSVF